MFSYLGQAITYDVVQIGLLGPVLIRLGSFRSKNIKAIYCRFFFGGGREQQYQDLVHMPSAFFQIMGASKINGIKAVELID